MAAADCVTVITKGLVSDPPVTSTKTTTEKQEDEEKVLITPTLSENESDIFSNNDEAKASISGLRHTLHSCLCERILRNFRLCLQFICSLMPHTYFI